MGCDGGNCGGSPSVIFGYVGTAILLKFLFGIDDVVWLAPFMAREVSHGRLVIAVKYVLINFTICAIAVALAIIVHTSIHHGARHAEDLGIYSGDDDRRHLHRDGARHVPLVLA